MPNFGFTLYFLADQRESPPQPDLEAVENRPWLWRRPYTVLELQHRPAVAVEEGPHGLVGTSGYLGTTFESQAGDAPSEGRLEDPDGAPWLMS